MTTATSPLGDAQAAGADAAAGRFLRALQILLKSARLYDSNHPQFQESLGAAERELRMAQAAINRRPLSFRVEAGQVIVGRSGRPASDAKGELKAMAEEFLRRGISTIVFAPEAHLGELGNLAALLAGRNPVGLKQRGAPGGGKLRLPTEGVYAGEWPALLSAYSISSIRVNEGYEERKADTAITGVLALVLNEVAGTLGPNDGYARTIEELLSSLRLLAQIGGVLQNVGARRPHHTALDLRALVSNADRRAVNVVVGAVANEAAASGLPLDLYVERLTEAAALGFVRAEFRAGREGPRGLRALLGRISQAVTGPAFLPGAGDSTRTRVLDPKWTEDTWAEHLLERFWTEMHAGEKSAVIHSSDAWCVPVAAIRRHVEPAFAGNEASKREARAVLLDYARCLIAEEVPARLAAASGLSEMADVIERLWPAELPEDLVSGVVFSMVDERSPEVAGLLSSVTVRLADIAFARKQYGEAERILDAMLSAPRGPQQSHLAMLAQRMLQEPRWLELVSTSLENRPLDDNLVQILGRDPERLLDHLSTRLSQGELQKLAPMARLVRAIGEPALGALVTRLFDPRSQRASASVKLLAATQPERLMKALPQALPSWEWNLQDMAVSELVAARGTGPGACARVFLESLEHAHPLVLPMMLDQIGLARETAAVPVLTKIAAGQDERLKDVYVRIKAIESLGRIGPACGRDAADLLRNLLRERRGLTHVEPAGLRAAAEEALGLIENWPSAERARIAQQALEKAAVSNAPPRRYIRIPLESPLPVRIEGPRPLTARVRTISLGGAFVETVTGKSAAAQARLSMGEAFDMEITAGLRKIHSKAVVRNVHPTGSGVEFVHMSQDDREKLRKLVSKLLKG